MERIMLDDLFKALGIDKWTVVSVKQPNDTEIEITFDDGMIGKFNTSKPVKIV